jgi:hypothetical protein
MLMIAPSTLSMLRRYLQSVLFFKVAPVDNDEAHIRNIGRRLRAFKMPVKQKFISEFLDNPVGNG